MAGVRFEDVDLLGALSRIVDLHTQHYKEDFDLDKELISKLAVSERSEDKQLLWMSRPCGTYTLREREVYLEGSHENKVWRFYQEQTNDPVLAYAIAIDAALEEKPKDFEELLQKLETAGLEVNRERKHLRFRVPGQENYTRCDTLKGDYTEQAIKERIAGTRTVKPRHAFSKKTVSKVGLLVDIEVAIRSGKGPGYERWAKVFNLKQLSQAVLYLKEHGDMGYEDLLEKANATTTNFNTLSVQIKDLESKMNANAELQKQIVNYAKTRAVYVEYRKAGYSKKFRTEHEAEILLHQAAKNHFDELGIQKLPSVKSLREEYTDLLEQKRKAYSAYKQAKNDMKELHNVRANVEYLLEISSPPQPQRSTEKSRQ